jgi:uracil-DNA glycosylase
MSEGFFSSLPTAKKSIPLLPRCGACGLFKQCQSPKMPPTGKGRRKVLIVGEAPGKNEDVHEQQFVGEAGQRLQRTLDKIDVEMRKDCRFTNAIICRPPRNRTPTGDEIDHCRPNLMNAIKEFQPETIILLGGAAVQSLLGTYWKADTGGILRWAGWRIPHQATNTWICPTFHPSYLNYEESPILDRLFEQHLRAAFALEGRPYDVVPDYASQVEIVLDDKRAAELIQEMVDRGNPISFDYETNMLKPDGDDAFIYTCSLSDGKTTFAYPLQGKAVEATKDFLRSDVPKSGHNLKFEDRWSKAYLGVEVKNWQWCSMTAAHILDNRQDICGLKFQAFALLGQSSYDDGVRPFLEGKQPNKPNRIREAPLHELLKYNGLDSLLEWHVAKIQQSQMGVSFAEK